MKFVVPPFMVNSWVFAREGNKKYCDVGDTPVRTFVNVMPVRQCLLRLAQQCLLRLAQQCLLRMVQQVTLHLIS